jgi:hypothetical protein
LLPDLERRFESDYTTELAAIGQAPRNQRPSRDDVERLPQERLESKGKSAQSGPSTRKSYYSNFGVEQTDISAPGGDYREFFGTPAYQTAGNLILAPYPKSLAIINGDLNPDGTPNNPFVIQDCEKGVCYGWKDPRHKDGLTLFTVMGS